MIDLTQFGSVVGLAVLVGVLLQLVKLRMAPDDPQKPNLPYYAVGLGIALAVLIAGVMGNLDSPQDVLSYAIGGLFSGLTAIGGYETTVDKIKKLGS